MALRQQKIGQLAEAEKSYRLILYRSLRQIWYSSHPGVNYIGGVVEVPTRRFLVSVTPGIGSGGVSTPATFRFR